MIPRGAPLLKTPPLPDLQYYSRVVEFNISFLTAYALICINFVDKKWIYFHNLPIKIPLFQKLYHCLVERALSQIEFFLTRFLLIKDSEPPPQKKFTDPNLWVGKKLRVCWYKFYLHP